MISIEKRENKQITKFELEVLIGTILGDSTIRYVYDGCARPNLTYSHSGSSKDYFYYKSKILDRFKSSIGIYKKKTNYTKGKIIDIYQYIGHNNDAMKILHPLFYKRKKYINKEFIEKYFTEVSLAFLFMDDGCKNIKTINLNLQNFDNNELEWFKEFLKKRFNLDFNIKKDKTMYLRYSSIETFVNLIWAYLHPSMYYKIYESYHKIPLNGEVPYIKDNPVLNLLEIEVNA